MWIVSFATRPRTASAVCAVFAWSGTSLFQTVEPPIVGANGHADDDSGNDDRGDEHGYFSAAMRMRGQSFILPTIYTLKYSPCITGKSTEA
ncbi:hypothetical protein EDC04DRAFT_2758410 [Pisolithus marmoratus]|nr:hypothetical protein EDC04DRAFT_2758410 [Pisolithus marmoratus]